MNELVVPTVENVFFDSTVIDVRLENETVYFHANQVADFLGYASTEKMVALLRRAKLTPPQNGEGYGSYFLSSTVTGLKKTLFLSESEIIFIFMLSTKQNSYKFKMSIVKIIQDLKKQGFYTVNNATLQQLLEENKQLKQQLAKQSQDFTEQLLQKNKLSEERKSKSNYYQVVEEIDIFGNKVSKYEHIPRDKELLYKLNCCENTIKGCLINGRKYIEELKTMQIHVENRLFLA